MEYKYDFSIIIPVYNSESTLETLIHEINSNITSQNFEIILVNDGSKDNSRSVCKTLVKENKNLKFIDLRKNFGEFNAVICGLKHVESKYGIIIDDDLQNPPSEITKLYQKAEEGEYDVVYSYYEKKEHHWLRNLGSKTVNYFTTYLLKKPKDLYLSSFKLIHAEVIDEIIKYSGPHPYIDGLIFQVTDNITNCKVKHLPRKRGESSYTVRKLISLFLTILFGYSMLPLRLIFFVGLASIIFSLFYMSLFVFSIISEWGSPIVILLCGLTLCSIAIVGEYVGHAFLKISGKPQYIIKNIHKSED